MGVPAAAVVGVLGEAIGAWRDWRKHKRGEISLVPMERPVTRKQQRYIPALSAKKAGEVASSTAAAGVTSAAVVASVIAALRSQEMAFWPSEWDASVAVSAGAVITWAWSWFATYMRDRKKHGGVDVTGS